MFAVRPRFGRAPVPEILADAVRAALEGTLPLAERLRQREADYRQDGVRSAPPRISWHNGEVSGAATGHRRGAGRRPGRAAVPADGGDHGGGARRHLRPDRDPGRRRRRQLLRLQPVGHAGRRRAARAGGRRARGRHPRQGGARSPAGTADTPGEVPGSVSRACDGRTDRDGTFPLPRGAHVDSRLWPCPPCGEIARVRAAAVHRRAHRRRRRVPRVGLRRLRLGRSSSGTSGSSPRYCACDRPPERLDTLGVGRRDVLSRP